MSEDFYIGLIYKQLDGILTPEEDHQLSNWETSSPENALTARSVREVWKLSGGLESMPELDLDQEFLDLQVKMDQEQAVPKVVALPKARRNWRLNLSIAAAILFLPLLFFTIIQINGNRPIKWAEVQTGSGEKQVITLVDGSSVTLNENTLLKYPTRFKGKERLIEFSGEAFFDIESNPEKTFIIKTEHLVVEVLGTAFSVTDRNGVGQSKVIVQEGKVALSTVDNASKMELTANDMAIYLLENNSLQKSRDPSLNSFAWVTNRLVFQDTPFPELVKTLETTFGLTIQLANTDLEDCTFNDVFEDEDLSTILTTLETVFGLTVEQVEEDTFLLKDGSCQ
ncbi:MAG: hypothetical protein Sapg2KO_16020 [Saprospiraceae bacterium]